MSCPYNLSPSFFKLVLDSKFWIVFVNLKSQIKTYLMIYPREVFTSLYLN
ncbi:hypothetical protein FDUTEX481_00343 [Tolypothrix sp. PCC 7601]|nr:hypothetical protein FDUTEX481_00343 [Tolypothrix sp. PCC 7601]